MGIVVVAPISQCEHEGTDKDIKTSTVDPVSTRIDRDAGFVVCGSTKDPSANRENRIDCFRIVGPYVNFDCNQTSHISCIGQRSPVLKHSSAFVCPVHHPMVSVWRRPIEVCLLRNAVIALQFIMCFRINTWISFCAFVSVPAIAHITRINSQYH